METLISLPYKGITTTKRLAGYCIACLLLLLVYQLRSYWLPYWILPDLAFLQLVIMGLGIFILLLYLNWRLCQWFWRSLALPPFSQFILQFKQLTLWQQFIVYWLSFFLLVFLALLSLVAIL